MGCGQSQPQGNSTAAKPAVEAAPVAHKAHAPNEYAKGDKKLKKESAPKDTRLAAYEKVKAKLPSDRSEKSVEERKALFNQWDNNGNGKLSLAEIDKACKENLGLEEVTDNLAPILIRAYYATLEYGDQKDDDGFIEFKQFRVLFEYIGIFFELMFLFEELGGADDRRISEGEFTSRVDKLREIGIQIDDPKATFAEMDANGGGGGMVLFDEFCEYCTRRKIRTAA